VPHRISVGLPALRRWQHLPVALIDVGYRAPTRRGHRGYPKDEAQCHIPAIVTDPGSDAGARIRALGFAA
jgi:hypothetical protein